MAYKDRFGVTQIRSMRIDNLSVSWDCSPGDETKKHAVFLYTQDMGYSAHHHHIKMERDKVEFLRNNLLNSLKESKEAMEINEKLNGWLSDSLNRSPEITYYVKVILDDGQSINQPITLEYSEAVILKDWLDEFLEDTKNQ